MCMKEFIINENDADQRVDKFTENDEDHAQEPDV